MSCGVGRRRGSDLALQWLWHRPAAIAPISPLAWEPPCFAGVALKRQKTIPPPKKKKKKKRKEGKKERREGRQHGRIFFDSA